MAAILRQAGRSWRCRLGAATGALALSLLGLMWPSVAQAYIGDSFVSIADLPGNWRGEDHRNWIRVEAHEWPGRLRVLNSGASDPLAGDKLFFGGPNAPRPGNAGRLILTLGKDNPALPRLMEQCTQDAAPIAELTFAESSDRARPVLELGARPEQFPAFWEYRLRQVRIVDCPVVEGAIHQALVLSFRNIDWLNYDPSRPIANRIVVAPEGLPDVRPTEPTSRSTTNAFLITWIAPAALAAPDQCPQMNGPPTDADFFRYLSPEEGRLARARYGERGVSFGSDSERRGPHGLNVVTLPGIVPDPGFHEPRSSVADGLDLDGDDGRGDPPRGIRRHQNYTAPDGRVGIDNQLFAVMGCVPGFQGRSGYRNQTSNARRADGNVVTLVEVSGIDDARNDRRVDVAIIYSNDRPIRDNAGRVFIPNYTFRPTDNPNFALYNIRVRGRIVDGVVITDQMPVFEANLGQDPLFRMYNARLRLAPQPDGSMRGVLAGYLDWKRLVNSQTSGYSEGLFRYQLPGLYYALRRNADGMYDPRTGEFNGISAAYEIDTVSAFIGPAPEANTAQAAVPNVR